MIIGIDESGTFDIQRPGLSLFAGAHILNSAASIELGKTLDVWKNSHSSMKDSKGEIKGFALSEYLAEDFVESIILPQKDFYVTVCLTTPSEHKKKDIQFHRDYSIKGLDGGIAKCKEVGNFRLAKQYIEMRNWYKNLSYQLLLKTWILGEMIGRSFREHVIQNILDHTDASLGEIKILMDASDYRKILEDSKSKFLRNLPNVAKEITKVLLT